MVDGDLVTFTRRAKDMLGTATRGNRIRLMNFLNASEVDVLTGMVKNTEGVEVVFAGGIEGAERQRAALIPSFIKNPSVDIPISVFKIDVIGGGEISHSQILGSLMGLDIDRNLFGEIVVDKNGAFFASCSEFDVFLLESFTKVGRHDIRLERVTETISTAGQYENIEIIVSSMRLDVIVKALIQGARRTAEEYLNDGYIRLNHVVDKKVSRMCNVGDLLSVRKHGRFKIMEIKKKTKGGKLILVVRKSV